MSELPVSEMFYTVQGEGPYTGTPAVFLRLSGCNLQCGAVGRDLDEVDPIEDEPSEGASWICDTIPVWKDAEFSVEPVELVDDFKERGFTDALRKDAHLVVTGGEPTLPAHQEGFVEFENLLRRSGIRPFVEVETNGTIAPSSEFDDVVDQFNVSLKLANSGHDEDERLNDEAINWHINNHLQSGREVDGSVFKFVVGRRSDLTEIRDIIYEYDVPDSMVSLMPAGQTREQLEESYQVVAELAKESGWRFSPRLHISIWNRQTGV